TRRGGRGSRAVPLLPAGQAVSFPRGRRNLRRLRGAPHGLPHVPCRVATALLRGQGDRVAVEPQLPARTAAGGGGGPGALRPPARSSGVARGFVSAAGGRQRGLRALRCVGRARQTGRTGSPGKWGKKGVKTPGG